MNEQKDQKTILLVEDEGLIALMEKQALQKHGFNVITVSSGEKAVESVSSNPGIDLILMDINLGKGKMDGTEAAEIILKERDIPILFLSSYTQPEMVKKTEKITSYGYVVKDSGETVLITSIKMAFRLCEAHQQVKKREEALQESEERYRTLIEQASDGVVITDSEGRYLSSNQSFLDMLGYSMEELSKLCINEVIVKEEQAKIPEYLTNVSAGTAAQLSEWKFVRKDGSIFSVETSARILPGSRQMAIIRDVTERKKLESQLLQAQKMEAIGTLAGGIAHDFNNILTAIMGYMGLMQMKMDKSSSLRPYVDQVLLASKKAVDLTQSLSAFSRKQSVKLIPLDINKTIKVAKKLLKRLLTEDIVLHTSLAENNMIVMADMTQMDQILFNLVTNARDAMPKGGALTIETVAVVVDNAFIKLHGFGEAGSYVQINISDTGTGIDEAVKGKIFDPFFTTKETGKGTGLGLSTVYGIVKQHNGFITVDSMLNHGTTFHIYLPAVTMKVDEMTDSIIPVTRGKETILIAEDDAGVRLFMLEVLQEYGYKVIEAVNGEDTIKRFKEQKDIDLVIIDSVMPKKNGREVYDEIHRISPHTRMLFTSGHTKDIILDKGIEEKKFDFIAKPLLIDVFLQKVREVMDRQVGTYY